MVCHFREPILSARLSRAVIQGLLRRLCRRPQLASQECVSARRVWSVLPLDATDFRKTVALDRRVPVETPDLRTCCVVVESDTLTMGLSSRCWLSRASSVKLSSFKILPSADMSLRFHDLKRSLRIAVTSFSCDVAESMRSTATSHPATLVHTTSKPESSLLIERIRTSAGPLSSS